MKNIDCLLGACALVWLGHGGCDGWLMDGGDLLDGEDGGVDAGAHGGRAVVVLDLGEGLGLLQWYANARNFQHNP